MRTASALFICFAFFLLAPEITLASGTITARASLGTAQFGTGSMIDVPVEVDLSALPEKLGSFTANLKWDASVLQFEGFTAGKTEGFGNAVVNQDDAGAGVLRFAGANPHGADGLVNVLSVRFKVIGESGASARLSLGFSAMAAAGTFNDLLPFLAADGAFDEIINVVELPESFALSHNYPNPFNPETEIHYQVPEEVSVKIVIFNLLGQRVRVLVDSEHEIGAYSALWDGRDDRGISVPSGVYVVRMQAGDFVAQNKMTLLK